jgi:hypothetical protein
MPNRLTCNDPFGYVPGLEDGNPLGPSPVSNSNPQSWTSSLGIIKVSTNITIDSVFASFSLNQQGGNYSTSGYLYEIWLDGFVNNGVNGNVLSGGKWAYLTDLLSLNVYDLIVIDTQDVDDSIEGNITKVLVVDPSYSESLLGYVLLIQQGDQEYTLATMPLTEHGNRGVFPLENNISYRVNFNAKDLSRIIDSPLLSYSSTQSIWIDSPERILSYPELKQGNNMRVQYRDNVEYGFEVMINGTPTYRGQVNDVSTNDSYINLTNVKVGDKIGVTLQSPYMVSYKKGDYVYLSRTIIDVRSGSYGIQYLKCIVVSFSSGILNLMVTLKPAGASDAGDLWYIISEVNQINIPISSNHYISLLDQSEIVDYNLLNPVFSVRLQIDENRKFNRYVFRYKPKNSYQWKYVNTSELDTIIENVLPNTIFQGEVMGFNDSTGESCGFSESGTFNTFF